MANTYKNIVITPSTGSSTVDPSIVFSGANASVNTDITLRVYPTSNGTLSFEGSSGQLFSIKNDLTKTIFSVNDSSGIPLVEVNVASQQITFGQTYGNVGIGTSASNSSPFKLDVAGNANVSTNLRVGGNVSFDNIDSVRIWEPAANTLTFHTASTERVRIANTGNVGIGTATPGEPLTVSRNTTNNNSSVLAGTVARFIGPDGVQSRVILDAYGAGTNMSFRHASGTAATPTATSSGSSIIGINGFGYGTSGYTTTSRASFNAIAAETWTDAAQGTYLSFQTTATGSLVTSEKVRIDANGRVYIGAVPSANVQLYVGTTPNTLDSYVVLTDATIGSNATSSATAFTSNPSTAAASFTLPSLNHFLATQGSIGAGSAITNQRGFYAFNNLTGATNNYGFFSDLAFGANRWNFYGNGTAYSFFQGAVGFGNGPTAYTQQRIGGTGPSSSSLTYSVYADQTAPATTTSEFASFYSIPNTTAASFTLDSLFHFIAIQGTKGSGSTITNQFGFYVGNNLSGATNNYGFYSNIPIGANRWNFYSNGTANNYFNGNVGIGRTDPGYKLDVVGTVNASSYLVNGSPLLANTSGTYFAGNFFIPSGSTLGIGSSEVGAPLMISSNGVVSVSLSGALIDADGTANSYLQTSIRNANTQQGASSDYVATTDDGTDTTNYIDLGINNSNFSSPTWTINGARDGYLYVNDGNLSIGTANSTSSIKRLSFFVGGVLLADEVMRIQDSANGANVGIGRTDPGYKLDVNGTINAAAVLVNGSQTSTLGLVTATALGFNLP